MSSVLRPHFGRLVVISISAFLNSVGIGIVYLGSIFLVKEVFGAAPSTVGWFGAVNAMSYFAGCILFRRVTARIVPRVSMLITLCASVVIFSLFSLAPGLPTAFMAMSLFGLVTAFYWPPLMGWLSRGLEGSELSFAASLFNMSWSVGGILSPFLAGLLSERGKFLPIYVAVGIFFLAAVFVAISRLIYRDAQERPDVNGSATRGKFEPDTSTPLRFPAWIGVFAMYAVMGVVFSIFPVFARDHYNSPESRIGAILTVRALFTMLGFLLLGRLAFWHFKKALIPAVTVLTAALVIALAFAETETAYAIGFALAGLLLSIAYTNSIFYGASGAPDRDRRMTIHEALLTAGQILGSVAGGILYQAFSMRVVFIFLAVVLSIAIAAQFRVLARS